MGFLGLTAAGLGQSLGSGISSGLASAASGMITGAAGGLFGNIKAKKQHKRNKEILALQNQYEQERMQLQADMNKEQAQFNQSLALDMFDYTAKYNSPEEERKRLEEAGLSPALMYGGAGAGGSGSGSTAGAGAAQGVSALQPMGLQVALQAEMQKAQIDALNAQTLNTNAQTAKTASEIEKTESETKLNKATVRNTIENIEHIKEQIRASKINTFEQEQKNKILDKIYNKKIYTYFNGEKAEYHLIDEIIDNETRKIFLEGTKIDKEEAELINQRDIQRRLSQDIESIISGELDRLTLPTEQKKILKKTYERNDWELKNDKALGDIINDLGGDSKYSKLLQGLIKWLFAK